MRTAHAAAAAPRTVPGIWLTGWALGARTWSCVVCQAANCLSCIVSVVSVVLLRIVSIGSMSPPLLLILLVAFLSGITYGMKHWMSQSATEISGSRQSGIGALSSPLPSRRDRIGIHIARGRNGAFGVPSLSSLLAKKKGLSTLFDPPPPSLFQPPPRPEALVFCARQGVSG